MGCLPSCSEVWGFFLFLFFFFNFYKWQGEKQWFLSDSEHLKIRMTLDLSQVCQTAEQFRHNMPSDFNFLFLFWFPDLKSSISFFFPSSCPSCFPVSSNLPPALSPYTENERCRRLIGQCSLYISRSLVWASGFQVLQMIPVTRIIYTFRKSWELLSFNNHMKYKSLLIYYPTQLFFQVSVFLYTLRPLMQW